MTHPTPQPGRYREKSTDYAVTVLGVSSKGNYASVRIPARHRTKTFHVNLSRFRDDYEEVK